MQTITGQCLDMRAAPASGVDFTHYTITKYNAIVKWKTAFYSFYLPVACAMYLVSDRYLLILNVQIAATIAKGTCLAGFAKCPTEALC